MEVLSFQVGIFLIILIAGFFGKSARNTATILAVVFTLIMVFTSKLMIVQFITIGLAYIVSDSISKKREEKHSEYEMYNQNNSNRTTIGEKIGCFLLSILALLFLSAIIIEMVSGA